MGPTNVLTTTLYLAFVIVPSWIPETVLTNPCLSKDLSANMSPLKRSIFRHFHSTRCNWILFFTSKTKTTVNRKTLTFCTIYSSSVGNKILSRVSMLIFEGPTLTNNVLPCFLSLKNHHKYITGCYCFSSGGSVLYHMQAPT